jgi:hypothetical protein
MAKSIQENVSSFKPGLTWRSFLAMFTAILIFLPASIYLNLTSGAGTLGVAASFVIAIIFSEITRYFGHPLTKQELFIMFSVVSAVSSLVTPYYGLLWRVYYSSNPVFSHVMLYGEPLINLIPSWFVPKDPNVLQMRTFFLAEWFQPIAIVLAMVILGLIQSVSIALFCAHLFIDVEKLEFPFAKIQSSLVEVLSEKKEDQMRIFIFSVMIGLVFGLFIYAPQLIGTPIVPLPFVDLTSFTQDFIPGAIFGISTDVLTYAMGIVIPLNVAICLVVASMFVFVIANNLFLVSFPNIFPQWVKEYYPGMGIASLQYRSTLRIWLPFQFGMSMAMAIFYVFLLRKEVYRSFKLLGRIRSGTEEHPSLPIVLLIFLLSSLASAGLFLYFVPDYPALIAILLSTGYSFLMALISSRALGIGGMSPSFPYPWRMITLFTDYKGLVGWDFQPAIETGGSSGIVQSIRIAHLTETKPMDFIKMFIIGNIVALLLSVIFYDFFWRMTPIPSTAYPYTLMYWPQSMLELLMYATRQIQIPPERIGIGMVISIVLVIIESGLNRISVPFSAIGVLLGAFQIPPTAIAIFVGSFISDVIVVRIIPKWRDLRFMAMAGVMAGVSISAGLGVSVSIILKSSWIWSW